MLSACNRFDQSSVASECRKATLSFPLDCCTPKRRSFPIGATVRIRPHKHGKRGTRTYKSWAMMKDRCFNQTNPSYKNYGGRGITVCERWMEFGNFCEDMGERPQDMTLGRIDNNGGYEPGNCRWETKKQQERNSRNNRLVNFNGKMVPIIVVSEQTGVPYRTLRSRIVRLKWDLQSAISKPILSKHGPKPKAMKSNIAGCQFKPKEKP